MIQMLGYEIFDRTGVLEYLFHPRREPVARPSSSHREDLFIEVADQVFLGSSLHLASSKAPTLLFFHGNGEIVADYDNLGQLFTSQGLNFFIVDYRGYGLSSGKPMVSSMMDDSLKVFDFFKQWRYGQNLSGPLCIMGRSLGSAPAIEVAYKRSDDISCLIIESGFAWVDPLLLTLGIDMKSFNIQLRSDIENIDKIKKISQPVLIIHATDDHVISFSNGQALYQHCSSKNKFFLEIEKADHNNLFLKGMNEYLEAVKRICYLNSSS